MSQENVEIVRTGYNAFARGDLTAVLDLIDENIMITGQITPDGRPAQGGRARSPTSSGSAMRLRS